MNSWGKLTSIDLENCDLKLMQSKMHIKRYVTELCKIIDMKKYGKTIIEFFGRDEKVEGFSIVQLIETSSITGHFANSTKNVYLDIFSCANYSSKKAADFSMLYFAAKSMKFNILNRP